MLPGYQPAAQKRSSLGALAVATGSQHGPCTPREAADKRDLLCLALLRIVTGAAATPTRRETIYSGDRELRWTSRRFGDEFRELRLRAGISQAEVGHAIGVDRSAVTRLERGDTDVSST